MSEENTNINNDEVLEPSVDTTEEDNITSDDLANMSDSQFEEYLQSGKIPSTNNTDVPDVSDEENKDKKDEEDKETVSEKEDDETEVTVEDTNDVDNNEEQNQRIYGLDPGCIKDVSIINNLSEINLYFMINAMEQYIRRCKYDMFLDRIPKIDLTEEQYALEYMVYQTTKYGVELDDPTVNKHIIPTDSYRLWFDFYSNYFKNIFTNESFNSFWQIQNNGLGSSMFVLEKKLQKVKK